MIPKFQVEIAVEVVETWSYIQLDGVTAKDEEAAKDKVQAMIDGDKIDLPRGFEGIGAWEDDGDGDIEVGDAAIEIEDVTEVTK